MKTTLQNTRWKTYALLIALMCIALQSDVGLAQDIESYYESAAARSAQGDHEGAISDLNRIIAMNPQQSEAYNRRGNEYTYLQKSQEAVDDYTKAILLDPQNYSAYSNRSKLLADSGFHSMAIIDCNQAIAIAPNFATAYSNRAYVKSLLGLHEEAISDCSQAILLDPASAQAYNARAATYYALDRYTDALADYTKARELDPKDARFHFNIGLIKQNLKDPRGAVADFSKAIELQPQYTNAYSSRGFSLYALREWAGALSDFRQHAALSPNAPYTDSIQHFIWLTRLRLIQASPDKGEMAQEKAAATTALKQYFSTLKRERQPGWTHVVAAFLGGDITQEILFAVARTPDENETRSQLAEAAFYAGAKRLLENDTAAAIKLLQQCVDARQPLLETDIAEAELKHLKATPAS